MKTHEYQKSNWVRSTLLLFTIFDFSAFGKVENESIKIPINKIKKCPEYIIALSNMKTSIAGNILHREKLKYEACEKNNEIILKRRKTTIEEIYDLHKVQMKK